MEGNGPETLAEETTKNILEQLAHVECEFWISGWNDEILMEVALTDNPRMHLKIGTVDLWVDGVYVSHETAGFEGERVLTEGETMQFEGYITESEIRWAGPGLPELSLRIERV